MGARAAESGACGEHPPRVDGEWARVPDATGEPRGRRCKAGLWGDGVPEWKDTGSEAYKDELEAHFRSVRTTEYAELTPKGFEGLVQHVRKHSRAYWIKGAKPTRLKGYLVHWDINPDVPPLQA